MATVTRQRAGVTFDLRSDPPLKEFEYRVSRFTKGITDWRGAFHAMAELFKRQMVEQFETQGSASGRRWPDVKPAYATWKMQVYHTRKVGVRTRALLRSMTGGGGYSDVIRETSASFGMSSSSKARPYGAHFSARRPVIRMTARWGRQYQKVTHAWLNAEMRGAMGIGGSTMPDVVRGGGYPGNLQNVDLR